MKLRLLLGVVIVAVCAVPAFAQQCDDGFYAEVRICGESGGGGGWSETMSYENGDYLDNPCTPTYDPVWVDYDVYVEETGWLSATGERPVHFLEMTTMGGLYAASGASESEVVATQPYSLRKYHKVNTPDDFHVVTVIEFNPATRYTTITRETACGNGMPDSKE